MTTPSRIEYPHVTTDPGICDGHPCIGETGVRVTELAAAFENGNSPADLQELFCNRAGPGGDPVRPLTLPEVLAGLAYYHDNLEALEAVRAEDERRSEVATRERHAAILKHYLGG